jgi:hypothetical protein
MQRYEFCFALKTEAKHCPDRLHLKRKLLKNTGRAAPPEATLPFQVQILFPASDKPITAMIQ